MKKILYPFILLLMVNCQCTIVNAQKTELHFTVKGVKFTMKAVPAGTFQIGNQYGYGSEQTVHPVTLKAF